MKMIWKRSISWLLACMLFAMCIPQLTFAEDDITIDYGQTGYKEIGKGWANSNSVKGLNDSSTRINKEKDASVTWTPTLTESWYTISFYKTSGESSAKTAVIEINHKDGITKKTIDFSKGPLGWNDLGNYQFKAGTTGYVKLIGDGSGYIRADAVKFQKATGPSSVTSPTAEPAAPPSNANEIVMEIGKEGYAENGTGWIVSNSAAGLNQSKTRASNVLEASAIWTPNLARAEYKVSFYKVVATSSSRNGTVEVVYDGGSEKIKVDFGTEPAGWVELGTFPFAEGKNGYVKLTGDGNGYIRTSAVKFEKKVKEDDKTSTENMLITKLGALNIMMGDSNGFRPLDAIKRSEFAAVLVRAMGMEETAKSIGGQTSFGDVPKDHWASGYISFAVSQGIINGMGDGNFAPDANVTYEQALKMVVCALGYEPQALERGGYPSGYIVTANDLDLTENTSGTTGKEASRITVANMISNALDVPMMVKQYSDKKERYVISGTNGMTEKTFLGDFLKMDKYQVRIYEVDGQKASVQILKRYTTNSTKEMGSNQFELLGGINPHIYLNATVDVWVKDQKVYVIENDETVVIYDFVTQVNGDESRTAIYDGELIDTFTLKLNNKIYHIQKAGQTSQYELSFNGTMLYGKDSSGNYTKFQTADKGFVGNFARVFLNGSSIEKIDLYSMAEGGIITGIYTNSIDFYTGDLSDINLNGFKDADEIQVFIDGKVARWQDLKNNMLFDYYKSADAKRFVIVASSNNFSGVVKSFNPEQVIIENMRYEFPRVGASYYKIDGETFQKKKVSDNLPTDIIGAKVKGYLDPQGDIRYLISSESIMKDFYGVVEAAGIDNNGEEFIKVYNGKSNTYSIANTAGNLVVTAEQNVKKTNGDGIFHFKLDSKGKISEMAPINWILANNALGSGTPPASALGHVDPYTFYSWQMISNTNTDGKKVYSQTSGQVRTLDSTLGRFSVRPIASYTSSYGLPTLGTEEKYFDPQGVSFYILQDNEGNFSPKLLTWSQVGGKYPNDVSMKIEDASYDQDHRVVLLNCRPSDIRTNTKQYGFVLEKSKKSKTLSMLKVLTADGTTKEFTMSEYEMSEAIGYYDVKSGPQTAQENSFIYYVEGGIVKQDDDGNDIMLKSDGTARVLKVFDVKRPNIWNDDGTWQDFNTPKYSPNFAEKVITYLASIDKKKILYQLDPSGKFTISDPNENTYAVSQFLADSDNSGDFTLSDSYAKMDAKVMVFDVSDDLTTFTPMSFNEINTIEKNGVGDKVFVLTHGGYIKAIFVKRQ